MGLRKIEKKLTKINYEIDWCKKSDTEKQSMKNWALQLLNEASNCEGDVSYILNDLHFDFEKKNEIVIGYSIYLFYLLKRVNQELSLPFKLSLSRVKKKGYINIVFFKDNIPLEVGGISGKGPLVLCISKKNK